MQDIGNNSKFREILVREDIQTVQIELNEAFKTGEYKQCGEYFVARSKLRAKLECLRSGSPVSMDEDIDLSDILPSTPHDQLIDRKVQIIEDFKLMEEANRDNDKEVQTYHQQMQWLTSVENLKLSLRAQQSEQWRSKTLDFDIPRFGVDYGWSERALMMNPPLPEDMPIYYYKPWSTMDGWRNKKKYIKKDNYWVNIE